jgi:polysaccharide pyruvyl transferase WcaK-like protein
MKIGLFGNFGSGNLGNDASLEAMLLFLRSARPTAELVCFCTNPNNVRERFKIPAIPIRRQRGTTALYRIVDRIRLVRTAFDMGYIFRNARKFDAIIAPGTGLLDDFCDSPWGIALGGCRPYYCAGALRQELAA